MGQYYKPCILEDDGQTVKSWMYSHDYDNGIKIMEHSYIDNDFVSAFESLIKNYPQRVVWAGDYGDKTPYEKVTDTPEGIIDFGKESNFYDRCTEFTQVKPKNMDMSKFRYILNHDKKLFIDKEKCPKEKDEWANQIHPLPLLTTDGVDENGPRGGGDYNGTSMNLIGSWKGDLISIEKELPLNFKELIPNFNEKKRN
ncbi:MAG TPA: hypothetical protein VMR76_00025 [Candidatus Saccharimonadia bacterium]|nr:hypothetical protein [Candidatus Saccharimonadia bacterium]